MSDTSIQTRPNPAPAVPSTTTPPRADVLRYVRKFLKALASLRLTVFLFVLSMILVFCGTLAMMDNGLWATLTVYFRSFYAKIPLQVFVRFGQVFFGVSPDLNVGGYIPFPGGWTIGAALLVNLIAAHIMRFKFTWKRSGILLIHGGLILLMIGELVTGLFAVEGSMYIPLGGSTNYVENLDRVELAFVTPSAEKGPDGKELDDVVVIPESILVQGGVIHDDRLPADVEVVRWMANSAQPVPGEVKGGVESPATRGLGLRCTIKEEPRGRGVDSDQKRDMPSAYVTLKDKKTGAPLGTYLVSVYLTTPYVLQPQEVDIDGRTCQIALRQQRTYRPFTFQLKELKHDTYKGTGIARNYSSLIHLTDREDKEDREVLIYMNHPLFYRGETFYQTQVLQGGTYTGLAVVRNPGWFLPYISCTMVALGMVVHFWMHLLSFLHKVTR
jgi:hypothetical protein